MSDPLVAVVVVARPLRFSIRFCTPKFISLRVPKLKVRTVIQWKRFYVTIVTHTLIKRVRIRVGTEIVRRTVPLDESEVSFGILQLSKIQLIHQIQDIGPHLSFDRSKKSSDTKEKQKEQMYLSYSISNNCWRSSSK